MSTPTLSRNHGNAVETTSCDQDEVARVAYLLYEERGREDGHDLEDWLKAQEIVRQRQAPACQESVR